MRKLTDARAGRQALPSDVVKVSTPALTVAQQGLPVFPCDPATKRPLTRHGFKDATTDVEQIKRWWRAHPHALVGVPTGRASGLIAVDCDPQGREWYWQEKSRLGRYRLHQTRRGKHLLYRLNGEAVTNSTGEIAAGVDVRGEGGFIIWWPAHGMAAIGEPGELPKWLNERLSSSATDAPRAAATPEEARDWVNERPRVIQALAQLDPDMSHDEWRDVAAAISWATGGTQDGEDIFVNFSKGEYAAHPSQKFEGEELTRKKYRSFKNDKERNVTLATLYQMAKEVGGKVPPGRKDKKKDGQPSGTLVLTRACDIEPEPYDWLWEGWLARGAVHILAGRQGISKSTLLLDIAGRVTTGEAWPDGSECKDQGKVIIWSGEDSIVKTLRPRLESVGAKLDQIELVRGVKVAGVPRRAFNPAQDLPLLVRAIRNTRNLRLLIVDPAIALVEGDSNTSSAVRAGLQPLIDLAEEYNIAVAGPHHFTKNSAGWSVIDRFTGSLAFTAAPRIVWAAALDETTEEPSCVVTRAKSNIGPQNDGFRYRLGFKNLRNSRRVRIPDIPYIEWLEPLEGSADEIINQAQGIATDKEQSAEGFLRELLAEGPKSVLAIHAALEKRSFSARTLRRAKQALGVKSIKTGNGWNWTLPGEEDGQEAKN